MHDPLADVQPARRALGAEVPELGQRAQGAGRQAGTVGEVGQVARQRLRLGGAARVVPSDGAVQDGAVGVEQHPRLGHARDADADHLALGRALERLAPGVDHGAQQGLGIELGARRDRLPRGRHLAVGELDPAGVDHRGLAGRGADVDPEQQLHQEATAGGRQAMTTRSPSTSTGPAAWGTSSASPRVTSRPARVPAPSTTRTTAKPAGSWTGPSAGAMRWAVKNAAAAAGRSSDTAPEMPSPPTPRSADGSRAARSTLASATSHPSPNVAACSSSIPNPSHSIRIERSVGSWSSAMRIPSPIACGTPAGTKTASPALTGTGLSAPRRASWSWASTHAPSVSPAIASRQPTATSAPSRAARTIQASVLPKSSPRCSCANGWSGWWCTGRRSPASSSLTRSAGLAPKRAAWAAPSHPSGSEASASRTRPPSGRRLSPRSLSPKRVVAEPIHSSGEGAPPTAIPRSTAIARPPGETV